MYFIFFRSVIPGPSRKWNVLIAIGWRGVRFKRYGPLTHVIRSSHTRYTTFRAKANRAVKTNFETEKVIQEVENRYYRY